MRYKVLTTDEYGQVGEIKIGTSKTIITPRISIRSPQQKILNSIAINDETIENSLQPTIFEKSVKINLTKLQNITNRQLPVKKTFQNGIRKKDYQNQIGIGIPELTNQISEIRIKDYVQIAHEVNESDRVHYIVMPDIGNFEYWKERVDATISHAESYSFEEKLAFSINTDKSISKIKEQLDYLTDKSAFYSLKYKGTSHVINFRDAIDYIGTEREKMLHVSNITPKVSTHIPMSYQHILGARNVDLVGPKHPIGGASGEVINEQGVDMFLQENVPASARQARKPKPQLPKQIFNEEKLGYVDFNFSTDKCQCSICRKLGQTITTFNPSDLGISEKIYLDLIKRHNLESQLMEIDRIRRQINANGIVDYLKNKSLVINNESFLNTNYNMYITQTRL